MQTLECVLWHSGLKCEVVFDQGGGLSRGGLLYLLSQAKMPLSKFEANLMLCLLVRRNYFSLASSCPTDYFRTYALIANWLVFPNTVTIKF